MKIGRVILLPSAADDLEVGRDFYDGIELGVGEYFLDSLFSDLESLRLYAGFHSRHSGYFRMLSKRFPFAIYYDTVEDAVQVVAILDMRQDPQSIRSSLKRR